MKLIYALGDLCWITLGNSDPLSAGVRAEGRVVAEVSIPNHPTTFYLIETKDTEWPHLEVRDALVMSEMEEDQPPFNGDPVPDFVYGDGTSLIYPDEDEIIPYYDPRTMNPADWDDIDDDD